MSSIDLSGPLDEVFQESNDGAKFVLLGTENAAAPTPQARRKIRRTTRGRAPKLWGTLGMADNSAPQWTGQVLFSGEGNRKSIRTKSYNVTCDEIALVKAGLPTDPEVLERYISFENVDFPDFPEEFTLDEIPCMRLTLMLSGDEGALVYYQFTRPGSRRKNSQGDDGSEIEYIQPQPTPAHDCSKRDRLDYIIPILPPRKIEHARKVKPDASDRAAQNMQFKLKRRSHREKFVVKILTFKRPNSESQTILGRLGYHLQGHSHQLLLWDPESGEFKSRHGSALDGGKKTLFLVHGTFSETKMAFNGLLAGNNSWVKQRFGTGRGQYQQIIGFDHPTLSEGPDTTVDVFLDSLPRGFHFQQPVDLVSHSRGGLVAKWMALKGAAPIRKSAFVSCANGVGYFRAGRFVTKLLSATKLMLKGTGHPVLAYLSGVAQHSGESLLNLPGSLSMTPGSDALKAVAEVEPPMPVTYLPVIGDFGKKALRGRNPFKRWGARGLDLLLKPILGMRHDWVVGTKKQYIMPRSTLPPGFKHREFKKHMLPARHSDYFYAARTEAQQVIARFLARN